MRFESEPLEQTQKLRFQWFHYKFFNIEKIFLYGLKPEKLEPTRKTPVPMVPRDPSWGGLVFQRERPPQDGPEEAPATIPVGQRSVPVGQNFFPGTNTCSRSSYFSQDGYAIKLQRNYSEI